MLTHNNTHAHPHTHRHTHTDSLCDLCADLAASVALSTTFIEIPWTPTPAATPHLAPPTGLPLLSFSLSRSLSLSGEQLCLVWRPLTLLVIRKSLRVFCLIKTFSKLAKKSSFKSYFRKLRRSHKSTQELVNYINKKEIWLGLKVFKVYLCN